MERLRITRPGADEYAPYYETYIARVDGDDLISALANQVSVTQDLIKAIPAGQGEYSYAEGKWTIKELIGHVIDTERVMAYRALRFARNDPTPLPGFDQDPYVKFSNANGRTLESLNAELSSVREANIRLFQSFDRAAWGRTGIANDHPVSTRALAFIIAGHELHHFGILRQRYLK